MSELEEKLNTILSDANAMSQIMALAHSLNPGHGTSQADTPSSANESIVENNSVLPSQLNSFDPKLLDILFSALSAYNSENDSRANLLNALRPFMRKERYIKLDQAIQVSKITRAVRAALDAFHPNAGGEKNV